MIKKILKIFSMIVVLVLGTTHTVKAIGFDVESAYRSVFVVETYTGTGSAFAISSNTLITNAHVVSGSRSIRIRDYDNNTYPVTLTYIDNDFDIAVLKVRNVRLIPLKLSQGGSIKIGDDVYAIGSPKGLDYSLTKGIVSSVNRKFGDYNYIQTDTTLNPGNSGGPLLDEKGIVVGVNTLKIYNAEGLSLSIPIEDVMYELKRNGVDIGDTQGNYNVSTRSNTGKREQSERKDYVEPSGGRDDGNNYYPNETIEPWENIVPDDSVPPSKGTYAVTKGFFDYYPSAIWLIVAAFLLIAIILALAIYNSNKNVYHKKDPRERMDFDIDFM